MFKPSTNSSPGGPDVLGVFSLELSSRLEKDPRWLALLEDAQREAGVSLENLDNGGQRHSVEFPMPNVFFTVTLKLKHSKPPLTRKLEVADTTLGGLHEIIQVAMSWKNCHLHNFVIGREWMLGPKSESAGSGLGFDQPDEDDEEDVWLSELDAKDARSICYNYDFGDSWEVEVKVSDAKPMREGVLYPRIIDGKRPHPPDDCGGVWGYEELCDLMRKPPAELIEDEQERLQWCGRFDPDSVDLDAINAVYEKLYAPKPKKKKVAGKKKKA